MHVLAIKKTVTSISELMDQPQGWRGTLKYFGYIEQVDFLGGQNFSFRYWCVCVGGGGGGQKI